MKALAQNTNAIYGDNGRAWLAGLPPFLSEKEKRLNIKICKPFQNLTFHYVAHATTTDGIACVFKCGIPNDELSSEINALKYFNGQGAAKLLSANEEAGWLLLEKCSPGIPITTLDDDKATRIAIQTMQALWQPVLGSHAHGFKHINDWLQGLHRAQKIESKIPKDLIKHAITISKELLSSLGELVLLHGDLHHDNILSAARSPYLIIDPKGIIGELRGFDGKGLLMWSFVQAVLAAWWHVEDGSSGVDVMINATEVLYHLLLPV